MHRARAVSSRRASSSFSSTATISDRPLPLPPLPARTHQQYQHVGSKINSGPTVDKVKVVTLQQYVRRRQEAFCRVNPGQLRALLLEYDDEMRAQDAVEEAGGPGPLVVTHGSLDDAVYEKPFLLLDVRGECDSTLSGVIAHTRPFTHANLHQDKYFPELRRFKNLEGTLIVLYDDDERAGSAASMATQLVERGWENVFVLTGGLAAFAEVCPEYIEGGREQQQGKGTRKKGGEEAGTLVSGLSVLSLNKLPSGTSSSSCSTNSSSRGRRRGYRPGSIVTSRESSSSSSVYSARQGRSEVGSPSSLSSWRGRRVGLGSVSARSLASTTLSTASVAESVIQRARAKKGTF